MTLTGTGGAGKTRLGVQVAAGLADGAGDGVWFADLAPLTDPDLVAVAVADVLGVRQEPGRPVLDTLVDAVGGQSLLVLLDNCEHVIERLRQAGRRAAAGLSEPGAAGDQPGAAGDRRGAGVPGAVAAASRPTATTLGRSGPARRCGCSPTAPPRRGWRWPGTSPSAQVAGRICRRLDGIPLAIELAAARLRVMPAAELDARLDERFALLTGGSRAALPRQQTLRAMVDWSWELLTGAERAVLARLSVFAGGFGLAAAEAVAADADVPAGRGRRASGRAGGQEPGAVRRRRGRPGRYRLLETVRQYAAGQLDAQGPAAAETTRTAHRDYYLALAEAAAPQLMGADQAAVDGPARRRAGQPAGRDRVQPDPARPRAGIAAGRLPCACTGRPAGTPPKAAGALRALLDVPGAQGATLARARALAAAAHLLEQTGEVRDRRGLLPGGAGHSSAAGDDYLVAELLFERAWVLASQGQPVAALPLIEQGLGLARRLGEPHLAGSPAFRPGVRHVPSGGPGGRGPRCGRGPAAVPPGR